jgi:hypothetical protein
MTMTNAPNAAQALSPPRDPSSGSDLPTDDFEPVSGSEVGGLALLHHRTRSQAVSAERAGPGRYLAFKGGGGTQLVALQERTTHIGRGLTADIRIDDHRVSRLHASISQYPGGARVLDGRSLNGTFVNGQQVVWAELRHGDVIVLGPITMRFVELPAEACRAAGRVTRLTRGFARAPR